MFFPPRFERGKSTQSARQTWCISPFDGTTLHAGYSRLLHPPPVENVSGGRWRKFCRHSNEAGTPQDDPVRAERANYYDIGLSQRLGPRIAGWGGRLLKDRAEPVG